MVNRPVVKIIYPAITCSRTALRWTGRTTVSGIPWCSWSTWTAILSCPRRPARSPEAGFSRPPRPSRRGSPDTNNGRPTSHELVRPTSTVAVAADPDVAFGRPIVMTLRGTGSSVAGWKRLKTSRPTLLLSSRW